MDTENLPVCNTTETESQQMNWEAANVATNVEILDPNTNGGMKAIRLTLPLA